MVEKKWYHEGLHFKCTECGKCCTGDPGYVWLSDEDIESLVKTLSLPREEFLRLYTRSIGNRISLIEKPITYDCIFFKNKLCQVYKARPKQCRKFPWWPSNLQSRKSWEDAGKDCEGINHTDAPRIDFETIQDTLES